MHPILFEIPRIEFGDWALGPIPIRMYGLMIGIGFLFAITLASRRAKKEGLDPERILDLGVYVLLFSIIGARLLYVLTNLPEFTSNPLSAFAIWKGGLVFYGGLIAAVPAGIWYVRRHGMPVWQVADIIAPFIALGQGFGRLGCFFAGCCYGKPWSGMFCVTYHDQRSFAPLSVPLYPSQLMESAAAFLLFGLLLLLRRWSKFRGQLFWSYIMLYAVVRFVLELFRGDAERGLHIGGIASTSQLIAIGMVVLSGIMLAVLQKRATA